MSKVELASEPLPKEENVYCVCCEVPLLKTYPYWSHWAVAGRPGSLLLVGWRERVRWLLLNEEKPERSNMERLVELLL